MARTQLVPSVDMRISAWKEIQKKRMKQDLQKKPAPPSITISREFGCEAIPLAEILKQRLEAESGHTWTIFDSEMVRRISASDDMSGHLMDRLGERSKYLEYIVSTLLPYWKSQEQVYRPIVEAVFSLARQGNAILVEQGAFSIAKDLPNCYHFRLIAPAAYRAESYASRAGMSIEETEKLIREKETARIEFLSDFLNCDFEPTNFHMIFNNARVPVEQIAEMIMRFVGE